MKKSIFFILGSIWILTACGQNREIGNRIPTTNAVENALNEQIAKESSTKDVVSEAMDKIESSRAEESSIARESAEELMRSTEGVDYDLTKMSSDLVYASIYQLMMEPEDFEGKVFRIQGNYYSSYFDNTDKYYHYCIIKDALACCTQGLEFIWEDGTHIYPDEYPGEGDIVEITGTFELYKEEGDERSYCRLGNASLKVISKNLES